MAPPRSLSPPGGTFLLSGLPLLVLLAAFPLPGQGYPKIRYKKHRFAYQARSPSPDHSLVEIPWGSFGQRGFPRQSIREHAAWILPFEENEAEVFGKGPFHVFVQKGAGGGNGANYLNLFAALSADLGTAVKYEASSHRTAVWGTVHSWKYLEWAGEEIPPEQPVWVLYEGNFGELQSSKHLASISNNFRVSHLRLDGAGEAYLGEIEIYEGPGEDRYGQKGNLFRTISVNFAVDLSFVKGKPFFRWQKNPRPARWQEDAVHGLFHQGEWRTEVRRAGMGSPKPLPPESEYFVLLGDPRRGMQPARYTSLISWPSFESRRKLSKHPLPRGSKGRPPTLPSKLGKHLGFVHFKGGGFWFVCKPLGVKEKLEVPEDLKAPLSAWISSFPTPMSREDRKAAWVAALGKPKKR